MSSHLPQRSVAALGSLETAPTFVATCLKTTAAPGFAYDAFDEDGAGLDIAFLAFESGKGF